MGQVAQCGAGRRAGTGMWWARSSMWCGTRSGMWWSAGSGMSDGAGSGMWCGAGSDLFVSMLTDKIAMVLLMWKWMGLIITKNDLLRYWDCRFFLIGLERLRCFSCWYCLQENLRLDAFDENSFFRGCYFISINLPYCCYVWSNKPNQFLDMLNKLQ